MQNKKFQSLVIAVLDQRLDGTISNREAIQKLRDLFHEECDIETNIDQIIRSVSKRETKPYCIPDLHLADGTPASKVDCAIWRFWIDLGLGLSRYAEIGPDFIEAMDCNFSRPDQPFTQ